MQAANTDTKGSGSPGDVSAGSGRVSPVASSTMSMQSCIRGSSYCTREVA